jgi:PhoH-like ATPase
MYKGFREVTEEELAAIQEGNLRIEPNEYIKFGDEAFRYDGQKIIPLKYSKIKDFKPKNVEQKMLFDLLDNNNIPVKFAVGIAGSGKTRAAITYGLEKVKAGEFQRLFIVKQPAPASEHELGYLKGTKEDKMRSWMGSVFDNLQGGEMEAEYMIQRGQLEFDVVAYMLGRDLQSSFIIVDEAQLLTKNQVKLLGSRVSQGSVIVFCGDYEQIFNKKYEKDNGLIAGVDLLKDSGLTGAVTLTQSVRSKVAELFAKRL